MAPRRSRRIRWVLIALLGRAVTLAIAPLAMPRYPAIDPGDRTVVEGDRVEGCRSEPQTIARLWIDLDRLDRMRLIHELGHLFGLVGNPRHEQSASAHRRHAPICAA